MKTKGLRAASGNWSSRCPFLTDFLSLTVLPLSLLSLVFTPQTFPPSSFGSWCGSEETRTVEIPLMAESRAISLSVFVVLLFSSLPRDSRNDDDNRRRKPMLKRLKVNDVCLLFRSLASFLTPTST